MRKDTWYLISLIVNHRSSSIDHCQPLLLPISLIVPMAEQTRRRVPEIPFRVLIIGRANAGKTTILQRVCETTQSPVIYRRKGWLREEVRAPKYSSTGLVSLPTRLNLTRRSTLVIVSLDFGCFELSTEPAGRARDRRRTRFLQSHGLCLSRFQGNRVR